MNNFINTLSQELESICLDIKDLENLVANQTNLDPTVLDFIKKEFYYSNESFKTNTVTKIETFDIILQIIEHLNNCALNTSISPIQTPIHLEGYLSDLFNDIRTSNLNADIKNTKINTIKPETLSIFH